MNEKLNYHEAAALLGVPVGTLYAWVCRNSIPHHRYGPRLVRFSRIELEKWIEKHTVRPSEVTRRAK